MDTMAAFAMGDANRGKEMMVFDWDKAATLIKKANAKEARAGLSGDWFWTGGSIFCDGKPDMDSYTFLGSTWATPEIKIDGVTQDCFVMQNKSPHGAWASDTKWPKSAKAILCGD